MANNTTKSQNAVGSKFLQKRQALALPSEDSSDEQKPAPVKINKKKKKKKKQKQTTDGEKSASIAVILPPSAELETIGDAFARLIPKPAVRKSFAMHRTRECQTRASRDGARGAEAAGRSLGETGEGALVPHADVSLLTPDVYVQGSLKDRLNLHSECTTAKINLNIAILRAALEQGLDTVAERIGTFLSQGSFQLLNSTARDLSAELAQGDPALSILIYLHLSIRNNMQLGGHRPAQLLLRRSLPSLGDGDCLVLDLLLRFKDTILQHKSSVFDLGRQFCFSLAEIVNLLDLERFFARESDGTAAAPQLRAYTRNALQALKTPSKRLPSPPLSIRQLLRLVPSKRFVKIVQSHGLLDILHRQNAVKLITVDAELTGSKIGKQNLWDWAAGACFYKRRAVPVGFELWWWQGGATPADAVIADVDVWLVSARTAARGKSESKVLVSISIGRKIHHFASQTHEQWCQLLTRFLELESSSPPATCTYSLTGLDEVMLYQAFSKKAVVPSSDGTIGQSLQEWPLPDSHHHSLRSVNICRLVGQLLTREFRPLVLPYNMDYIESYLHPDGSSPNKPVPPAALLAKAASWQNLPSVVTHTTVIAKYLNDVSRQVDLLLELADVLAFHQAAISKKAPVTASPSFEPLPRRNDGKELDLETRDELLVVRPEAHALFERFTAGPLARLVDSPEYKKYHRAT